MYARSTTIRANPGSLDDAIAYMRDEVWPAMRRPASGVRVASGRHGTPPGAIAAVPRWRDPAGQARPVCCGTCAAANASCSAPLGTRELLGRPLIQIG
jgi:hypothetical protein